MIMYRIEGTMALTVTFSFFIILRISGTSGTTGLPKGVSFTHRQIVLHTLASIAGLSDQPIGLKSSDVMMPLVPIAPSRGAEP